MKNSSNSNHSFHNQIVLVTGAASGIGRATAFDFAEKGAKVVISDTDSKKGEESAALIQKKGGEALFIKCDISKESDVKNLIQEIIKNHGRLDIAFNNAGIEGASSHSGRRFFATKIAEAGTNPKVLQNLLGHRNLQTTMRYVEISPTMMRNAVELMS